HRARRAAAGADVGLDALDDVGNRLLAADVQRRQRDRVADDLPDGGDPHLGRRPQPDLRRRPARRGAAMRRVGVFFLRRIAAAIFALFGIYTLAFLVCWSIPTTPSAYVYPFAQHLSNYQIQNGNRLLGVDHPKYVLYFTYLWHLVRHGFGYQWRGAELLGPNDLKQIAIGPQISSATGETLSIILGGAILVVLLAVPLGALAARVPGSITDRTISLVALIGICTHPMVLGLVLNQWVGARTTVLSGGYCPLTGSHLPPCTGPQSWAEHLVLPWVTSA